MKNRFIILPLAMLLLGACATPNTDANSSGNETNTSLDTPVVDNTNYGTKDAPLTVSETVEMVEALEAGEVTKKPIFVKGIIGHNWDYKEDKKNTNAYYSSDDGTIERAMSLFNATFAAGIDFSNYKAVRSMVGKEVLSTGVASYYIDSKTDQKVVKIQTTTILSVADPATPRIPETLEATSTLTILADGTETKQIEHTIKPYGCTPVKPTYSVSGNDHVTVDENGNVKCAVGATTDDATVTVTVGTLTATVTVKVTLPVEGQTSLTVDLTKLPDGVTKGDDFALDANHVKFTADKGGAKFNIRWWTADVRMYNKNSLTMTPDSGFKIESIEFDVDNPSKATYEVSNATATLENKKLKLVPTDGTQAMVFKRTGEDTTTFTSVKIVVSAL